MAGKKNKYTKNEFNQAILLDYLLFKQCEGYSSKDVVFFKKYLKEEAYEQEKRYGWKRHTYTDISTGLMGYLNGNRDINVVIDKLVKSGYIERKQKGYNKNKKGELKSNKGNTKWTLGPLQTTAHAQPALITAWPIFTTYLKRMNSQVIPWPQSTTYILWSN